MKTADFGKRLLTYFREQQSTRGNVGCECGGCQDDMTKALERLINEGVLSIRASKKKTSHKLTRQSAF